MIPLCDERAAAVSILQDELNYTASANISTDELWQIIIANTECYAPFFSNILNDGKPWYMIRHDIESSHTIAELIKIYDSHPALQKHKQFLDQLTKRKLKIK